MYEYVHIWVSINLTKRSTLSDEMLMRGDIKHMNFLCESRECILVDNQGIL